MEQKLLVSQRALLQRINRKLAPEGERVLRMRENARDYPQYGPYIRVDCQGNYLVDHSIDLEELGRELGVIRAFEKMADD